MIRIVMSLMLVALFADRASMMKMDRPAYKACMERRGYTLRIEP